MNKKLFFFLLSFPLFAHSAENPYGTIRFVEAKVVKELSSLPPQIEMTLEVMCNEEFVKIIRHEWIEPKSKITNIAVGALFKENLLSSCAGITKEIKINAGPTYSGRQYEILRIKK
jgi:hypothetical protein